jgi:hypothetical protein
MLLGMEHAILVRAYEDDRSHTVILGVCSMYGD